MTYNETMALLYLAKRLYPRDKSLDRGAGDMAEVGEAWAEMLKDISFEVGKAAVAAHAANSPYAPAISEIRAYARRMTGPEPLTAEEAWQKAIRAIRRYGSNIYGRSFTTGKFPSEMARDSLPPDVWHVVDQLGYTSMCLSPNEDVVRGQFIRAWERFQKRKEEREGMLPFLPEGLRDRYLAIESGEEE